MVPIMVIILSAVIAQLKSHYRALAYHLLWPIRLMTNYRWVTAYVYRSEFDAELEGDVKFKNMLITPPADSIKVDWNNQQLVEVGLRYEVNDE